MLKRIGVLTLAGLIGAAGLAFNERSLTNGAAAFVLGPPKRGWGRPLTPVSVAGVARRTARRCAVGRHRLLTHIPIRQGTGNAARDS